MTANLEIFLLGGVQVRQNGVAASNFMSSKAPSLEEAAALAMR